MRQRVVRVPGWWRRRWWGRARIIADRSAHSSDHSPDDLGGYPETQEPNSTHDLRPTAEPQTARSHATPRKCSWQAIQVEPTDRLRGLAWEFWFYASPAGRGGVGRARVAGLKHHQVPALRGDVVPQDATTPPSSPSNLKYRWSGASQRSRTSTTSIRLRPMHQPSGSLLGHVALSSNIDVRFPTVFQFTSLVAPGLRTPAERDSKPSRAGGIQCIPGIGFQAGVSMIETGHTGHRSREVVACLAGIRIEREILG